MAITVRSDVDELIKALVVALNALQDNGTQADGYHRDLSQITTGILPNVTLTTMAVTAAAATTLGTSITLANNIYGILMNSVADDQAHIVSDGYATLSIDGYSPAVDLASVIVLLNACKLIHNAHLSQAVAGVNVHVNNDSGNVIATAAATDQTSANTLANALKAAINLHILSAKPHNSPRIHVISC
jgi:hypothetical protein